MSQDDFHALAEKAYERLPDEYKQLIQNAVIIVDDYPEPEIVHSMRLPSKHHLLGLYQGIPLTRRGTWYGASPVTPDKISLYQKNIEAYCRAGESLEDKILEVLVHEIGHHFGMNEEQIRSAGF